MSNYYINFFPMYNSPDFPPLISGGGTISNNIIYNGRNLPGNVSVDSFGNTIYQTLASPWANLGGVHSNRIITDQQDFFNNLSIGSGGTSIKGHWQGNAYATWSPTTIADGAMASTTIAVPGSIAANGAQPVTVGMNAVPAGVLLSGTVTTPTTVGTTAFTGTGLNDAVLGGFYGNATPGTYEVKIDSAGATDHFKWRKDTGSWTTGVAITGAAQTLAEGVTVTFGAKTGHTLDDDWTCAFTCAKVTVTMFNHKGSDYTPGAQMVRVGVWQY